MVKIVLVGAGNVATHLGKALKDAGNEILQVFSKTERSANLLAQKLEANSIVTISDIILNADLYIISITDDNADQIIDQLTLKNKLVVHTSGFLSMDILGQSSTNYGVFYPLQTFSKSREVDMKSIPVCIEANTTENYQFLKSLASEISTDVREINSEQRKVLHLAAVFACNFPNFMYTIAEQMLHDQDMDFSMLKPLILETAQKVQFLEPLNAQTGPAFRGDHTVMQTHNEMLKNHPDLKELYDKLSKGIHKLKNDS